MGDSFVRSDSAYSSTMLNTQAISHSPSNQPILEASQPEAINRGVTQFSENESGDAVDSMEGLDSIEVYVDESGGEEQSSLADDGIA